MINLDPNPVKAKKKNCVTLNDQPISKNKNFKNLWSGEHPFFVRLGTF